jgi:hypothetical protein
MSGFYESIQTKDAKALDRHLQDPKNCGYSLWHFSLSLAKNYYLFPWKDYREAGYIEVLKKEKRGLEKDLDRYWKMPLIKNYHHLFIKNREEEIKEIDGMLNSQNTKGRPAESINIMALTWSYFIDSPVDIIELLAWFKKRLENIVIYKPFCDGVDKISKESLRKLLHRHKTDGTHKAWVEECKNLFISAIRVGFAISFEDKRFEAKWPEKPERFKDTPLISFPNGEILTVGDFEENNRILKVEDKNRAHVG